MPNIIIPKNKSLMGAGRIFEVLIGILVIFYLMVVVFINIVEFSGENSYVGTLNVLNWTSYIPQNVIKDFEKEYNIKVNYSTYSSNEELLAKISSSNEGTYDLIFPSDYMVSLLIYRNMLEKIDISKIENYQNINPILLNQDYDPGNSYSLPFLLATTVIAYDEEKLGEIYSYRQLFDDKLKNSLILIDDQRAIIGTMLMTLGYEMNDTDDEHLNESLKIYGDLKENIKAFDSDSPKTFLITEEADAGIVWSAEAILAQEVRPSIKYSYAEEGFLISMDNYAIPKNAKNIDNAYLFIDYLLRDDVAQKIIEEYPYISSNKNVDKTEVGELEEIMERGSYVENVGADIRKFDKIWAKYK